MPEPCMVRHLATAQFGIGIAVFHAMPHSTLHMPQGCRCAPWLDCQGAAPCAAVPGGPPAAPQLKDGLVPSTEGEGGPVLEATCGLVQQAAQEKPKARVL